MDLSRMIVKTFQYIYSRVLHFNDYCFTPSENQKKQIGNFISYLGKQVGLDSIGEEWVYNFLVFGFKQRTEQKTRYQNRIPLNWVIGKKAFELYQKRGESWLYFNSLFEVEYNMSFDNIKPLETIKSNNYYEELRRQNYRDVMPLSLCFNTVQYNIKSKYCLQCKDKNDCKNI